MSFERVASLSDVPTDEALAVTVDRYDVAIARHGDEVFALQDLCSHAAVQLSEGEVGRLTGQLDVIVDNIAKVSEAATSGVATSETFAMLSTMTST